MAQRLRVALTRVAMALWIRFSEDSWRDFSRPADEPRVETPGPDPVRIVILGGGANLGYGLSTHQISFGGNLSRQLARRLARGVVVDIIASPELPLRSLSDFLPTPGGNVDVIVTTVGSLEAYQLQREDRWRADLEAFLADVSARDSRTLTFVGGIVPPGSLVSAPRFARTLVAERVVLLNSASRSVCKGTPRAVFVPFPSDGIASNRDKPTEQYRAGAAVFTDAIAVALAKRDR